MTGFQDSWSEPSNEHAADSAAAGNASLRRGRTAQILLRLFSYREAALFHPAGTEEEKLSLYAAFGGLPAYLSRWESTKTLRQNVISAVLRPGAPLYDEPTFVLRTELGEPHTYSAILAAVAAGGRCAGGRFAPSRLRG